MITLIDSRMKIGISNLHISLGCCPFYGGGSVVNSLFIVALIVCVGFLSGLCFVSLLYNIFYSALNI